MREFEFSFDNKTHLRTKVYAYPCRLSFWVYRGLAKREITFGVPVVPTLGTEFPVECERMKSPHAQQS